jgi:hypothetical protein
MVLNVAISDMDDGEPMSPRVDDDKHVYGTPVVGDDLTIVFTDMDGVKRGVTGTPIRFDTWSSHHGFGGHNIYLETDDPLIVDEHDAEDDRIHVRTRNGSAVSKVLVNRPGAGLNATIARSSNDDDIQVYVASELPEHTT